MLETPSIRRYSSMSQPSFRVWTWVVKIRSVRTISRKDSCTADGLPVSWMGRLFQLPCLPKSDDDAWLASTTLFCGCPVSLKSRCFGRPSTFFWMRRGVGKPSARQSPARFVPVRGHAVYGSSGCDNPVLSRAPIADFEEGQLREVCQGGSSDGGA